MPHHHFRHVETWVFDLDNTLYPREVRLFEQIEALMTEYVMRALAVDAAQAARLRDHYWRTYGTTLAGLMHEHGLEPDPFLAAVHDIDLSAMSEAQALAAAIAALPGRKIVYTNGSREHARRVTAALGLARAFDALYGCEDAGYLPKPRDAAFHAVFDVDGLAPSRAAMFEDDPRNLEVPHALGMRTVLVGAESDAPHVEHCTRDLAAFLQSVV